MTTALVALVATLAAAPVVVALLRRHGRLDLPNQRSSHATPTPRGGGLAMLVGVLAAAVAVGAGAGSWSGPAWVAVGGCVTLALVGLVDDWHGLTPLSRLAGQAVVGVVLGVALGGVVGAAVGAVVLPAAVNMVNFMDGIDGLCATHAVVWGSAALLAADRGGGPALAVLGALALGGGLGFLPWNFPRARMFLGDVGSYLVGALAGAGVLAALDPARDAADPWTVLGLVCTPYLLFAVDTAAAIVRRARAGEPVFEAHRTHVYQRLVNEGGLPHWVVSSGMAVVSAAVASSFLVAPVVGLSVAVVAGAAYLVAPRAIRQELAA